MDNSRSRFSDIRTLLLQLVLLFTALVFSITNAHAFCAGALIKEIKTIAANPGIIEAIKESNSRQLTHAKILEIDERWIKFKGKLPEAEQIKNSKSSALLTEEINKRIYFKEAILTGNQGETVAMNMVTSDYWQGDEEKFTSVFDSSLPSRKPDAHISRARWDESARAMIAQVSVPVYEGETMIGTLTVGVDLKRVPQHPAH